MPKVSELPVQSPLTVDALRQVIGAVEGPSVSTDSGLVLFDGVDGKLLKNGPALAYVAYSGQYSDLGGLPALGNVAALNYPGGTSTFLRSDGTFAIPAGGGSGDVVGPASSVNNQVALFDGTTGKLIKTGGILASVATSGIYNDLTGIPTLGTVSTLNYPGGTTTFLRADGTFAVAGFLNPMTTAGDLIVGGTAGAPDRLGIGTNNQILRVIAGAPTWTTPTADVLGPGSAVGDTIALFDGTTGKAIKDSATTIANIRQIPQNIRTAAYTLVLSDAGGHVFHPSSDATARIFTIPANASVAFPIGTAVTFVNRGGTVTISITSDTLRLSPLGTTGSRTLAVNGVATAIKIAATEWMISGTGLT